MRKQTLTVWTLWLVALLLSLWAVGQAPIVTNELFAWISNPDANNNITIVWQELLAPRRTDLFQIPVSILPAPHVGLRVVSTEDTDNDGRVSEDPIDGIDNDRDGRIDEDPPKLVLPDSNHVSPPLRQFVGRPQISADGRWVVFYGEDGQVYVTGDNDGDGQIDEDPINGIDDDKDGQVDEDPTTLISYANWKDTDNSDNANIRDGAPPPSSNPPSVLPAISGNGRIVVFLSRDPNIYDPDGDGDTTNNTPPNDTITVPPNGWLIYVHDRNADESNNILDEARVGATTTKFLPAPSNQNNPLFVRLTEVRLSLDASGAALAFSFFTGNRWELWFVRNVLDVQNNPPQLVAFSSSPFSVPSITGSSAGLRLAFTASGPFTWGQVTPQTPPVAGIHVLNLDDLNDSFLILTNGVNGAPVLSRDGNWLAFHTTATRYQRFGIDPIMQPFTIDLNNNGQIDPADQPIVDRNAVDDIFVFNLEPTRTPNQWLPIWSTLLVRGVGAPPIALFVPCTNPALPSSSVNLIAFQEIVNGQSRVRIVNPQTNAVLR